MKDSFDIKSSKLTANIKAAGCAAKIGSAELGQLLRLLPSFSDENLLTGMENFEDAAVYKVNDDVAIIQTVDFFPALVDDPFTFGRIAAANALSDVYAMGGRPILALNILCFPTCEYPMEVVQEILKGGAQTVADAGAVLAGGHSIQGTEPVFGMSVMGIVHPQKILTNDSAKENDAIILCKPIGTGVGLLGLKGEVLSEGAAASLISNLTALNDKSLAIALRYAVHAATDVTGFGLIGHLHEMAQASGLKARLLSNRVPLLPEVKVLAEQGFVPAAAYANRKSYERFASFIEDVETAIADLLYDPQTSGGLLLAVENTNAEALLGDLQQLPLKASFIGNFKAGTPGLVEVVVDETSS